MSASKFLECPQRMSKSFCKKYLCDEGLLAAGEHPTLLQLLLGGAPLLLSQGQGNLPMLGSSPLPGQVLHKPGAHGLPFPLQEAHHGPRHAE